MMTHIANLLQILYPITRDINSDQILKPNMSNMLQNTWLVVITYVPH